MIKGGDIVVNTAITKVSKMPIVGNAVFAAHDEEGETVGLTAEQCAELERRLTTRRREPEQEAESRNGEAEAVRNAVGCESVP